MLRSLLLLALALFVANPVSCRFGEAADLQTALGDLVTADLVSSANGRGFRVTVAVPATPPPATGYRVLYLLDGNSTLPMALDAWDPTSDLILVGIGYATDDRDIIVARRYFDLTPPTPAEAIPLRPGATPPETGGRDAFLAFLLDDVKPWLRARYAVDTGNETLFGHSLGGLFALHVLFTAPDAFTAYVAADPSVWWNGHQLLDELAAFAAAHAEARVLIETAGASAERPNLSAAEAERLSALRGGPNGVAVAEVLRGLSSVALEARVIEGATHGSMLPVAAADAVAFASAR